VTEKKIEKDVVDDLVDTCKMIANIVAGDLKVEEDLGELLRRDSIAEAKKMAKDMPLLFGKEHDLLMLGHSIRLNEAKNNALINAGDSVYSDALDRYHGIICGIGFEKVLELDFVSSKWENRPEKFFIFWRKDGLLLSHDTFNGKVNSGHVYFNWRSNGEFKFPEKASGGLEIIDKTGEVPHRLLYPAPTYERTTDPVILEQDRLWREKFDREGFFAGDIDCRVGVKFQINELERTGTFLSPWLKRSHLWLLHHDDTAASRYDYQKINEERIDMLPSFVREAITP
jgi:hypothetical protein